MLDSQLIIRLFVLLDSNHNLRKTDMKLKIQRKQSEKGLLKKTALYVMEIQVEFNQSETESLLRLAREMIVFEVVLPPQYPISDNIRLPGNLISLSLVPIQEGKSQLACLKLTAETLSKIHNENWLDGFKEKLQELKALLQVNSEMDAKPDSEEIDI